MPLSLLITILCVVPAPSPASPPAALLEQSARVEVAREFERVGRQAPARDAALDRAAALLASNAIASSTARAAEPNSVARAVAHAEGHDPSPRALLVRASPWASAVASLANRADLNEEPATHTGVAVATRGDEAVVVVLLADRKATLEPFPRRLPDAGSVQTLCGAFRETFQRAEVFVTRPQGGVEKVPLSRTEGATFCAVLSFPSPGTHQIEVLGVGARGPEVVALFDVAVGPSAPANASEESVAEPTGVAEAREALLGRINRLRASSGLPALRLEDDLNGVAQQYSDEMAREHFFAHVSPRGTTLSDRLGGAGIHYGRAGENLGLASGPLAAHQGIERSPGHRRNLLDPEFSRIGLGVAFETLNGRRQALVTEVLAAASDATGDPAHLVYQSMSRRRAELQLPALRRSAELDALALEHARRALAANVPNPVPETRTLEQAVFEKLADVDTTSVDVFVASSPTFVPESHSLRRRENDRVGIGAVRGGPAAQGKDRYWVVVIYAGGK